MFFEDYLKTQKVYHIASINDLKKILEEGIKYDDKVTYEDKYCNFHCFIDSLKPDYIPAWVKRQRAIFATMNYRLDPNFHSHTVVMALTIDPSKCWIANESRANQIYEPFILQEVESLKGAKNYIDQEGKALIEEYWKTSLSFEENLSKRMDLNDGYDAEVLILHSIEPKDVEVLYIVSDHRTMKLNEWKKAFCKET